MSRTCDAPQTVRVYKGHKRKIRIPAYKIILLAPIETIVKRLADQGVCRIVNFKNREIIPQRKSA